jgi:hypothetical protein
MRSIAVAGLALAATLSLASAGPAAAGGDGLPYPGDVGRNYHGTGLYVHHHSYAPPSIRNVYAVHSPGPYHVHVLQTGGFTYVFDSTQNRYVASAFARRGTWQWQGGYRRR